MLLKKPAAHAVQLVERPPGPVEPAAQSVQKRSIVAEPGCVAETTLPAAQVAHCWQDAEPGADEK